MKTASEADGRLSEPEHSLRYGLGRWFAEARAADSDAPADGELDRDEPNEVERQDDLALDVVEAEA